MTTEQRVRTIAELGATVVCSTPTYALRLAQEARRLGIDLPASSVERLILSGEPAGSIPARKALIEGEWGAKAGEVVDPETGRPVGYGELGERVVTSFGRGMIPVLRHRTRDLVVWVPPERCPCGRTWDLYEGGIRERVLRGAVKSSHEGLRLRGRAGLPRLLLAPGSPPAPHRPLAVRTPGAGGVSDTLTKEIGPGGGRRRRY